MHHFVLGIRLGLQAYKAYGTYFWRVLIRDSTSAWGISGYICALFKLNMQDKGASLSREEGGEPRDAQALPIKDRFEAEGGGCVKLLAASLMGFPTSGLGRRDFGYRA